MSFPVKAVIFDWAGTMIDHGCCAPVAALQQVFGDAGVSLSDSDARAEMGMAKHAHIAAILAKPEIAARFFTLHDRAPGAADVAALHDAVEPLMQAAARDCAQLIEGAAALVDRLRAHGVRIGSSTGYTRAMMADIVPLAAAQGYAPDCILCSGDTPEGRPSPLMAWQALVTMGVWPASAAVKVDDAVVGIREGRHAGMWTVGVSASGNGVGLTAAALAALDTADRAARIAVAEAQLRAAGADYVIASVADLWPVIETIAARIAAGDVPRHASQN